VFRTANVRWTQAELAQLVANVSDWERVMAMAEREMATSHLARALHGVAEGVPAAVLDDARRRALAIDLRMQFLSRRLQQTCGILAEREIPFILLKGAALGAIVDPTFRSRPMSDVDILVRQEDVGRATGAIEAAGWSPTRDEVLRNLLADSHHLPPFLDPQMSGIRVELHVAHLPTGHPFAFDESALWRDARAASTQFAGARVPSPEHLLLHAAVHFAWQHPMTFGAWRTFRVVSAVGTMPDFDWDRFTSGALSSRAVTASFWTLRLAERLSGIGVPEGVSQRLSPPTPGWALDALERHFIATIAVGETPASPSAWLNRVLWLSAIRPRWSGHAASREWDPENRWGQAYGTASTDSTRGKVVRHLVDYRGWTGFLTKTLFGKPQAARRG
jgi:hypothetical protein